MFHSYKWLEGGYNWNMLTNLRCMLPTGALAKLQPWQDWSIIGPAVLNLSQSPLPQSSRCGSAITALLQSQQAEKGREKKNGLSGVKIERERNVIVRWWPKEIKEAEMEEEAGGAWARERRVRAKRGRREERKNREREAEELCSCASVLNNHFCVRGSTHQQRTSSIALQELSQRKNSYHWCQILALLSHGSVPEPHST